MPIGTLVQGLISTGIGRIGPVLYQRFVRRGKIDAALKGSAPPNTAVEEVLHDFEVVTGSMYGNLTESLDRFLRALETSGIVVALAEDAALGIRKADTKNAFIALHNSVLGDNIGNANELYSKITKSFEVSISALIIDPAMALLIKSAVNEMNKRLDLIEENTRPIVDQNFDPTSAENTALLQKIARAIANQHKEIRVETSKGAKFVAIDKIFIPSKLSARREPGLFSDMIALDLKHRKPKERQQAEILDLQTMTIAYSDFRNGFRRAVVLGDPGGGKSTLCQYLCHQTSKQLALSLQFSNRDTNVAEPRALKLPLRLVLRSFESARSKEPQLSIYDYMVKEIRSLAVIPEQQIEQILLSTLTYGHAILAFDGLDEIMNSGVRREFVDLVVSFCDQFPLCPVLVTSRLVGYEDASLPPDFEELVLEKFDDKEVLSFTEKFLKVFSQWDPAVAEKKAVHFMEQTVQNARDLRQNPLMLGLMAFLFASKGDVPTNRPEIYKECATLMFEKWDQNRSVKAKIPSGFDMLHLFSTLASKIYGDPELEVGVSKRWLIDQNRSYFSILFDNKVKAAEASRDVTEFVVGRAWVMSEFGPDVYRFTHRTFMEYFFARSLEENHETVGDLFEIIGEKIASRQWDVISHLALQIKTFRHHRRTNQATTVLMEKIQAARHSCINIIEFTEFSALSLQYMMPTESECREIVAELVLNTFHISTLSPTIDTDVQFQIIRILVNGIENRRHYVREVVTSNIVECIKSTSSREEYYFGLTLLSSDDDFLLKVRNTVDLPPSIRNDGRRLLQSFLLTRAKESPSCACVYVEWYRDSFEMLFAQHKFRIFFTDSRVWPKLGSHGSPLLAHMIIAVSRYFPKMGDGNDTFRAWSLGAFATIFDVLDNDFFAYFEDFKESEYLLIPILLPTDVWISAIMRTRDDYKALLGIIMSLTALGKKQQRRDSKLRMPRYIDYMDIISALEKSISKFSPKIREKFAPFDLKFREFAEGELAGPNP